MSASSSLYLALPCTHLFLGQDHAIILFANWIPITATQSNQTQRRNAPPPLWFLERRLRRKCIIDVYRHGTTKCMSFVINSTSLLFAHHKFLVRSAVTNTYMNLLHYQEVNGTISILITLLFNRGNCIFEFNERSMWLDLTGNWVAPK